MRYAILVLLCLPCAAQSPAASGKTVALAWTDAANPAGTAYSVYRSNSTCASTSLFVKIASTITTKSYDDIGVGPGQYCYRVTATKGGMESLPSNSIDVAIELVPPSALSATVK